MASPHFLQRVISTATGSATLIINRSKWEGIPIPPFVEQHRIVVKVDELMVLCDQVEAHIKAKSDTATRYAEAIVQQIAAA